MILEISCGRRKGQVVAEVEESVGDREIGLIGFSEASARLGGAAFAHGSAAGRRERAKRARLVL
jgi:hypothetical protein